VSDPNSEIQQRNRQIAKNESLRQKASAVRVSSWMIAIAVLAALAAFGWMFLR